MSVNFQLQALAGNFAKSNTHTPSCVFLTFFKLYRWYQIAQHFTSIVLINPFVANVPILYRLKTPRFAGIFRGYKIGTLVKNGLTNTWFQHTTVKQNVEVEWKSEHNVMSVSYRQNIFLLNVIFQSNGFVRFRLQYIFFLEAK